ATILTATTATPTVRRPAVMVGLAGVARGPRLLLQPTLVSYLFTAITLFVLLNSARWPAYALPASLGVLFALWVNLDQWFFIGPALVALFLLGEWLQQFVPRAQRTGPALLKLVGITLAIELAACLLNAHHFRAFSVLPSELVPNVSPQMQKDKSQWAYQFLTATDILYRSKPELGYSIPGLCYWLVMAIGALS